MEFDYQGLSNHAFTASPLITGDTFTARNANIQMVKFGVNYRLRWDSPIKVPILPRDARSPVCLETIRVCRKEAA